jgi:putative Ca2+/H+ antiporter (TMEM165/GDT1 family)
MEALLTSFLAAALAEWGDKTQLFVVALAVRYRAPLPILAGVVLAASANALIAALGGVLVHDLILIRAISLLLAVALVFAGVSGLIVTRPPALGERWKSGPFLTAAGGFFLVEFGDKTQFLTGAIAAQYDSLLLAAAGAAAGVALSSAPAALLGDRMEKLLPVRALRIGIAALFLFVGFVVAVSALRLI